MTRVLDLKIPPVQKMVLVVLADAANDRGITWVGLQHVSEQASVSVRTAQRMLAASEADGLLGRRPRYRKDGSRTSSEYVLFPRNLGGDILSYGDAAERCGSMPGLAGGDDSGVTLTTTEPSVNLKNHHHIDLGGLKFPPKFPSEAGKAASRLLENLPVDIAQQLLDELVGRMQGGGIKSSPVSYLRSLIGRQAAGTFVPELAYQIAEKREKLIAMERQAPVVSTPASLEVATAHLQALKKKLGRGR